MATAVTPLAHVSWLKHVGNFLGKILQIASKAAPEVDMASKVAEMMFPQFAPGIGAANNVMDNIAKEATAAELMEQAGAGAQGGPAKLQAVLAASGPAIDQWVASSFPGSTTVSAASKAGLVNAVVSIMNEIAAPPIGPAPTPATTK